MEIPSNKKGDLIMEARFHPARVKGSKILAFADVVVAEGIVVRGFRVVNGEKGLFAAVPSRNSTVGGSPKWINQVVFATPELRERFLGELLESYHQWASSGGGADRESSGEPGEEDTPF
jgi:stage V sporulation protein G